MDLIAFLNARLDEDEARLRLALDAFGVPGSAGLYRDHFNPERLLREIEAKRKILAETFPLIESEWGGSFGTSRWGLELLGFLALPYSDHPDYREEWED